ncbi:hypothetical protein ApAK_07325 [Thermoplasmatales archaeon AK]|nr:hypothetical protein [Thermoplasmatales archaeon AK]
MGKKEIEFEDERDMKNTSQFEEKSSSEPVIEAPYVLEPVLEGNEPRKAKFSGD